jgi:plasmid stabilization system protein ParE
MTFRLVIREQALADTEQAARWYEGQRPGLGRQFAHRIDQVLARIQGNPEQYQIVHRDVRRAVTRQFPYGVFYRVDGENVLVFAVVDLRRDAVRWQFREGPENP